MIHRYNIFRPVSREEYLRAHPGFIDEVLEASIKNAGAINLLTRKQDFLYVHGFDYLYPQVVEDLCISHNLTARETFKVLERREYKGKSALIKKKRDYFVRVFVGSLTGLDAWVQRMICLPGSEYRWFCAIVRWRRITLGGTALLDAKRKYRGPGASGKSRPDVRNLIINPPIRTPEQKRQVLVARAILHPLADSKDHALSTLGPNVQKRVNESQRTILWECEQLQALGAIHPVTPDILRITEKGMELLDILNVKLRRHVGPQGPIYGVEKDDAVEESADEES